MRQLSHNIDRDLLSRVLGRAARRVAEGSRESARVVSAAVLAETGRGHQDCKCSELGLEPGYPVDQLVELESGCTGLDHRGGGWVCPRLDTVRRRYGQ